jgi:hypothetical protein
MKKLTLDCETIAVESFQVDAQALENEARITCRCTDCNCTYTCPYRLPR